MEKTKLLREIAKLGDEAKQLLKEKDRIEWVSETEHVKVKHDEESDWPYEVIVEAADRVYAPDEIIEFLQEVQDEIVDTIEVIKELL